MTPKEECEDILNALLPFAENQLRKRGAIFINRYFHLRKATKTNG